MSITLNSIEPCAPSVMPLASIKKTPDGIKRQSLQSHRKLQSMRSKYNHFIESGKLDFLANNVLGLTALVWTMGDFAKVFLTANNLSTTGPNAVTPDEKFATIMKTAADGFTNILLYWVPFFLVSPLAKKGAKHLLGKKASKKAVNFTGELMALAPIAVSYYGVGSLAATKLANTAIDNKSTLKNTSTVDSLMKLGEEKPSLQTESNALFTKPASVNHERRVIHRPKGLIAASNLEVSS